MNIYQAALKLRQDYSHTGIELDAVEDTATNMYFVHHDALHTYLNCPPSVEYEPLVLATELILGGQDYTIVGSLAQVSPEEISNGLASIEEETLNLLIEFYTQYYNN